MSDPPLTEQQRDDQLNEGVGAIIAVLALCLLMVGLIIWLGWGAGLVLDAIILLVLASILMSKKR